MGETDMSVRALLHYALEVPDLTIGERFYRRWGPPPPADFGENKELA
jgi:hypothetical protein